MRCPQSQLEMITESGWMYVAQLSAVYWISVPKGVEEAFSADHSERNHQGLANALICPEAEHAGGEGEVHRRERLGGLLNYYYRRAA